MSIHTTEEGLNRVVDVPGLAVAIVNGTIGAGIFALPAIISIELGAFGIFGYLVELAYTDQDNVFLDYLVVMHPSCVPYAV